MISLFDIRNEKKKTYGKYISYLNNTNTFIHTQYLMYVCKRL